MRLFFSHGETLESDCFSYCGKIQTEGHSVLAADLLGVEGSSQQCHDWRFVLSLHRKWQIFIFQMYISGSCLKVYLYRMHLEPIWPLFLKVNPLKRRVIWVPACNHSFSVWSLVLACVAPLPSVAVYILWLVNTALILQPPLAKGRHLCIMRPQNVADVFWELCFPSFRKSRLGEMLKIWPFFYGTKLCASLSVWLDKLSSGGGILLEEDLGWSQGKVLRRSSESQLVCFFVGNVSVKGYSTPPNFLSLEKGTFKKEMNHLYNPTIIFQGIFFQLS